MLKIAKRSNKTRAEQRPPLTVVTASPALLAEMARFGVKPKHPAQAHPQSNDKSSPGIARNNTFKIPSQNIPGAVTPGSRGTATNGTGNHTPQRTAAGPIQFNTKKEAPHSSPFHSDNFGPAPANRQPKPNGVINPAQNGKSQPPLLPERSTSPQNLPHPADAQRPGIIFPSTAQLTEPETKRPESAASEAADSQAAAPETARIDSGSKEPARPASGGMERHPNIEQLMKLHPELPDQTMVLGVCEDGLPVLLDINNPAPGAVLVIGDERERQLELLRTAISSVVLRNSPRQVQFLILSCEPQSWKKWAADQGFQRYSIAIESAEDSVVRDWVLRLADWTEQRRLGERGGPAVLLVMDTLSFLPRLDYDVRLNFEWMAKEGPQAAIWPLAAISTDLAKALSGRRLLRAFKTRILGYTAHSEDYIQLVNLSEQTTTEVNRPGQFMVQAGEDWLRFRLPGA